MFYLSLANDILIGFEHFVTVIPVVVREIQEKSSGSGLSGHPIEPFTPSLLF